MMLDQNFTPQASVLFSHLQINSFSNFLKQSVAGWLVECRLLSEDTSRELCYVLSELLRVMQYRCWTIQSLFTFLKSMRGTIKSHLKSGCKTIHFGFNLGDRQTKVDMFILWCTWSKWSSRVRFQREGRGVSDHTRWKWTVLGKQLCYSGPLKGAVQQLPTALSQNLKTHIAIYIVSFRICVIKICDVPAVESKSFSTWPPVPVLMHLIPFVHIAEDRLPHLVSWQKKWINTERWILSLLFFRVKVNFL